jgi:predicted DCC family thiol-disulfide oxidoreductase YuxK
MNHSLIYFDGVCVLCNNSIRFLLKRDHQKRFKLDFIQNISTDKNIESIVLVHKDKKYYYSTAIIKSITLLGGVYTFAVLFILIPKQVRDYLYKHLASNRYKWFGKHKSCPLPPKDWDERMI